MKRVKKFFELFLTILILLAILQSLYKKIVLKENIKLFGYGIYIVNSGSMEPEFSVGEAIITKKCNDYNIDDIITYNINHKLSITHRIVEKVDNTFITKGDFNNANDLVNVDLSSIEGKVVFHSKILGAFIKYSGYILCIFIATYLILLRKNNKKEETVNL